MSSAAHRVLETARFTTQPELDEAAALRYPAWMLVRQGDLAEAERIAVRAAERLDGGLLVEHRGRRTERIAELAKHYGAA